MMEDRLKEDLKQAQLERDETRVSTLRLLLAEIANTRIAKGSELSDEEIVLSIRKEAKKRKEAIEGFRSGGREQAAAKEEAELKMLEDYLPQQLQDEVLTKIVEDVINKLGANSLQDMGKVMGEVMSQVKDKADGGRVSALVKERLSS